VSTKAHPLEQNKEYRILRAMKQVLTGVIKDTATAPGMKHPLSDRTIEDIRQCLALIATRERELIEGAGRTMGQRPYYADEPPKQVGVPVGRIGKRKKGDT
jgi:hypothetical protein